MDSEKVKEIKKALVCCSEGKCEKCSIGKKDIRKCVDTLLKDILTLINELEIERGEVAIKNNKLVFQTIELLDENKELQDRLADLEEEKTEQYKRIMELEQDLVHAGEKVFYRECNVTLRENEIKATALKHFAERLREKCKELENKYSHLCKSKKEAMAETCRYQGVLAVKREIDETLKECIDEKV